MPRPEIKDFFLDTPDTVDTAKHSDGNTINVAAHKIRNRSWFFTLNNYTKGDIQFLLDTLDTAKTKYVFQEELGEQGTPHLQGVIYFENARRLSELKQLNQRIHWERVRCLKKCVEYCSKVDTRNGETFYHGFTIQKPLKIITELRPWQQKVIDLIKTEPDDRSIYWFWDDIGNHGKTSLVKYIITKHKNAHFFTSGKASDIAYQLIELSNDPEIVIFTFSRSKDGYISYDAIEQVKDGLLNSPKYKGGTKVFNSPHVIILANFAPDLSKLSEDRWNVTDLNE